MASIPGVCPHKWRRKKEENRNKDPEATVQAMKVSMDGRLPGRSEVAMSTMEEPSKDARARSISPVRRREKRISKGAWI